MTLAAEGASATAGCLNALAFLSAPAAFDEWRRQSPLPEITEAIKSGLGAFLAFMSRIPRDVPQDPRLLTLENGVRSLCESGLISPAGQLEAEVITAARRCLIDFGLSPPMGWEAFGEELKSSFRREMASREE